eukprot:1210897-Pyramimonas_sp.AAC.1
MVFWRDSGSSTRNRLIRGVGIPRTIFWHAAGSSNGCLPTRQCPQWRWTVVGACEEGAWREG